MPMAKMMRNCASRYGEERQRLADDDLRRCRVAGAQAVPCVPAVFDEEREAGHPDDVEPVDDGFARNHLFRAVRPGVAVRASSASANIGLRNAMRMSGKTTSTMIGNGSRVSRRSWWTEDRPGPSTRHR